MSYELEYTKEDIGEILLTLRVEHRKLTVDAMANMLGINVRTLENVEEGKGAHVFSTFNKAIELNLFKEVKIVLEISN